MTSFIYLAHIPHTNEEWDHDGELYKIGVTTNLNSRLIELRKYWEQEITYITFIPMLHTKLRSTEKQLHIKYNNNLCSNPFNHKYSVYTELFVFDDNEINNVIQHMSSLAIYDEIDTTSIPIKHKHRSYKPLTLEQANSVITSAKSYEDRLLVLIGFTIGMNRDDLVKIEIRNIDIKCGILSYHKSGRVWKIPLSDRLIHELKLYIKDHTTVDQKYLFPPRQITHNCGHMSSKTAYNIFNAICKDVNIPTPIPIRVMRSTCINLKLEDGWTIDQIEAFFGRNNSFSTMGQDQLSQLMRERGGL